MADIFKDYFLWLFKYLSLFIFLRFTNLPSLSMIGKKIRSKIGFTKLMV